METFSIRISIVLVSNQSKMGEISDRNSGPIMSEHERIADLTVEEFKTLIRETVQTAMVEVMVEFSAAAERDAEVTFQAEVANFLRSSLHDDTPGAFAETADLWRVDD